MAKKYARTKLTLTVTGPDGFWFEIRQRLQFKAENTEAAVAKLAKHARGVEATFSRRYVNAKGGEYRVVVKGAVEGMPGSDEGFADFKTTYPGVVACKKHIIKEALKLDDEALKRKAA